MADHPVPSTFAKAFLRRQPDEAQKPLEQPSSFPVEDQPKQGQAKEDEMKEKLETGGLKVAGELAKLLWDNFSTSEIGANILAQPERDFGPIIKFFEDFSASWVGKIILGTAGGSAATAMFLGARAARNETVSPTPSSEVPVRLPVAKDEKYVALELNWDFISPPTGFTMQTPWFDLPKIGSRPKSDASKTLPPVPQLIRPIQQIPRICTPVDPRGDNGVADMQSAQIYSWLIWRQQQDKEAINYLLKKYLMPNHSFGEVWEPGQPYTFRRSQPSLIKPLFKRSANTLEVIDPQAVEAGLRSAGHPLDPETRSEMETYFGYDFSRVRLHTDHNAEQSVKSVNALAYTVGPHVVFGSNQYAPATSAGRRLLVHELTHVVQQDAAPTSIVQRTRASAQPGLESRLKIIEEAGAAANVRLAEIILTGPMPPADQTKVIAAAIIEVEDYSGIREMRALSGSDTDGIGQGATVYHARSPDARALSATRGIRAPAPRKEFPWAHINDAEMKIFEDILSRLPPNAKGTIHLMTMRKVKGVPQLELYAACSGCLRASFELSGRVNSIELLSHAPVHPPGRVDMNTYPGGDLEKPIDNPQKLLPKVVQTTPKDANVDQSTGRVVPGQGTDSANAALALRANKKNIVPGSISSRTGPLRPKEPGSSTYSSTSSTTTRHKIPDAEVYYKRIPPPNTQQANPPTTKPGYIQQAATAGTAPQSGALSPAIPGRTTAGRKSPSNIRVPVVPRTSGDLTANPSKQASQLPVQPAPVQVTPSALDEPPQSSSGKVAPIVSDETGVPVKSGGVLKNIAVHAGITAGTILLGFVESYIKSKLDQKQIDRGIAAKWPAVEKQIYALFSEIASLKSKPETDKVYAAINVTVLRGRTFYGDGEHESVAQVESISVAGISATDIMVEPNDVMQDPLEGVFSRRTEYTFSVPLWSREQERAELRAKQQAEIVQRLSRIADRQPKAPPQPSSATPSEPTSLLAAPSLAPSPKIDLLPGAPGPSSADHAMRFAETSRSEMVNLLAFGEKLVVGGRPTTSQILAFRQAEEAWRLRATYAWNHFKDNGPDRARAVIDEVLHADGQGGRLTIILRTLPSS
jgi:hypothetical protein